MQVTATEAKNRFGYYCSQAKAEPVIVEKDGRPDTVLVDFEAFQALKAAAQATSMEERRKAFNATYADWISEQNAHFEANGLWCDGQVAWPAGR